MARRESAVGRGLHAHLTRDPSRRRLLRSSRSPWVLRTPEPRVAHEAHRLSSTSPRPTARRESAVGRGAQAQPRAPRRARSSPISITSHRPTARRESAVGRELQAPLSRDVDPPVSSARERRRWRSPSNAAARRRTARRLGARAPLVEDSKHRCCGTSHRPSARRESAVGRGVQAPRPRDPSRWWLLRSSRSPRVLRTPRAPRRARSSPNLDHLAPPDGSARERRG